MSKINIIYLIPELKNPTGGAKVIYNHSDILNKLNNKISSQIIHLKKKISYKFESSISKRINIFNKDSSGWDARKMRVSKNFTPSTKWHNKNISVGKNLNFNYKKDFIILPEIWAHFADDLELKKKKINYAIFVQGFYHMQSTDDFDKLKNSYRNSKIILSDSEYSIKCLNEIFPEFKKKIVRVHFSIDGKKFKINKKKNLITYMPRKLPDHSNLLFFYLKNLLPKNWEILPIINVSEKYLIKKLASSKIFLSFSNLEGIGIPPIEAALSGNKIIGYSGGGGAEYWKGSIFKKVENGEIADYGQKVLKEINNYKLSWIKKTKNERIKLAKQYSKKLEKESLINLTKKIREIFQ